MIRPASVCILYGFGEGPLHARNLRKALKTKGFRCVSDPGTADILITHSGGNMILPKETADKIVIMMNPSCTQWHKLPAVLAAKMLIESIQSLKHGYLPRCYLKTVCNAWYTFARTPYIV